MLAAALELHARIINAYEARDEAMLPPGFKFFESMPKAPAGCQWAWDIRTQKWTSWKTLAGGEKKLCSELKASGGEEGGARRERGNRLSESLKRSCRLTFDNHAPSTTKSTQQYKQQHNNTTPKQDGVKYLLGIKYLPNGFEIGYNHYAGRLGLAMPETAALLKRHPVDWHEFSWCARRLGCCECVAECVSCSVCFAAGSASR